MEKYLKAKSRLFSMCRFGVVNRDDPASKYILEKGSCQFEHITATDDLGSHYASEYEWSVKAVPFRRHIYTYLDGWGPFHQSYRVQVRGIAPEAEWIRLEYRLLGRSFSLNIDLTKEAEA